VAKNDDQVEFIILQSFFEPVFLDGVLDPLDDSVICIACEIKDEAKS
jgi:hypothetical protein